MGKRRREGERGEGGGWERSKMNDVMEYCRFGMCLLVWYLWLVCERAVMHLHIGHVSHSPIPLPRHQHASGQYVAACP